MKNLRTFTQFVNESKLNEIKIGFTKASKSQQIFDRVDKAIKGGKFYEFDLKPKVFMKPGGKRLVQAEKWTKYIWVTADNMFYAENDKTLTFGYDYKEFNVDKRYVQEKTEEEYLHYQIDLIFKQMHTNLNSDQSHNWDAEAAGVSSSRPDQVNPYIDCGFMVAFAKRYKINLKKYWSTTNWTMSYDTIEDMAKKYPFKK